MRMATRFHSWNYNNQTHLATGVFVIAGMRERWLAIDVKVHSDGFIGTERFNVSIGMKCSSVSIGTATFHYLHRYNVRPHLRLECSGSLKSLRTPQNVLHCLTNQIAEFDQHRGPCIHGDGGTCTNEDAGTFRSSMNIWYMIMELSHFWVHFGNRHGSPCATRSLHVYTSVSEVIYIL